MQNYSSCITSPNLLKGHFAQSYKTVIFSELYNPSCKLPSIKIDIFHSPDRGTVAVYFSGGM